jgi:hypothetical protein
MKKILFACVVCGLIFFPPPAAIAEISYPEMDKVFSSAESLFKAMKERNCPAIWGALTKETKKTIVDNVYKSTVKSGNEYSREQINIDFEIGGLIAKTYWKSYLAEFDPTMILEQSKWEIGFIKSEKAEIKIQYKKSVKPAVLKMYKEDGIWKTGLEETFGARGYLDYLLIEKRVMKY